MGGITEPADSAIAVGRILGAHGVAGYLKVQPLTDFPERCKKLARVLVQLERHSKELNVERAALHGRFWRIKFAGIENREEAAALRGGIIMISPEERVPLPRGSYYHDQLIGLMVYNSSGEKLGRLDKVLPGAAHDHYLIGEAGSDKKEFLLPAVKEFVLEIDLAGKKLIADPPAGLLEL